MTKKQKRFCDEYLIDCNATQAAIRAGYSKKSAYSIGEENLRKPEIKAFIEQELEKIHNENIADAKEIMEYLTLVLRGQSNSEIVIIEGVGDGVSKARHISKTPDEKERLKAAELLGKRYNIFNDKISLEVEPIMIVNDLKE